jgi:hypothetical protein
MSSWIIGAKAGAVRTTGAVRTAGAVLVNSKRDSSRRVPKISKKLELVR